MMKMFARRFANALIDSFMYRNNKFKQKDNESSSLLKLRIMPKNSRTKIQKKTTKSALYKNPTYKPKISVL